MTNKTVSETQNDNLAHFLKNGPGLSSAYKSYIVKKDTKNGLVIIGGLGGMGVGQMIFKMQDSYKNYPGFDEAEECDLSATFLNLYEALSRIRDAKS